MSNSINHDILNEIRDLQSDSDPHVLVTLLRLFLGGIPQKMTRIETAIKNGKAGEVRAETHSLKSSSANIGATQMSFYCTELEKLANTGALTHAAGDLFSKLKTEVTAVVWELENLPEMKAATRKSA